MIISREKINKIEILTLEASHIKTEIAPELGGKILSVFNKHLQKDFLWNNKNLKLNILQPGDDYDANFWGGIDELIPNDLPETIDSIPYPDHGELWTTPLDYVLKEDKISMFGKLKLSGLNYQKDVYLDKKAPIIHLRYKIKNETNTKRYFLWKLHAALVIEEGDKLVTDAKNARVVDLDYSRFSSLNEFKWPIIEGVDASIVPRKNNAIDFFYLYDIVHSEMKLLNTKNNHSFKFNYDNRVFPFQWYFASYGGFLDHYTAILEPSSSMPMSVNSAKEVGKSMVLEPNEEINTYVSIYAGENI